jgi:electron transfer flavoprotein beta subunit
VVVVSIGPAKAQDTLRTALAMGADRGFLIETDGNPEPLAVAKLLWAIARIEEPGLILMGKQAIDDDCSQTGQMLAALMDLPQGTFASKVEIADSEAVITREIDGGLETLGLRLPAIVTTDLRLNAPRSPSLPNIMKAKSKPITIRTAVEMGVDITPRLEVLNVSEPAKRKAGVKVDSIEALVAAIKSLGVAA